MNLYFNRPANELIFVTRSMHSKLHREMREKCGKLVGKIGGKSKIRIEKCSIPILQFTKDGTFIKEWQSINEAGRQLGIAKAGICACCKGKAKSAGRFYWKYKKA